jgi:hypothetical protein
MPALPTGRERRRLKRYVRRIPARFQSDTISGEGHVKNVSKEGLFLCSDSMPEPQATLTMTIEREGEAKIEVTGQIRWTTEQSPERAPGVSGFGVQIPADCKPWREFFEQLLLA